MSEESVRLSTAGLLSKWGFHDGDVLDELLFDAGYDRPNRFYSGVLIRVVSEFLLPVLRVNHSIATVTITTQHNPIRATEVDGQPVHEHRLDQDIQLFPTFVDVPVEAILRIAGAMDLVLQVQEGGE